MTLPLNFPATSAAQSNTLAVTQPVAVQPAPQAMEQAGSNQPGSFQSALDHLPVELPLAGLEASVVHARRDSQGQEPQDPVVFHTSPRKTEGNAQESKADAPASQAMERPGAAGSTATRTPSRGCCDDPATTYILWNDDGSCAAAINCCATGVLRSCNALARLPGAVADCLPSSQSLHSGCDRMVSGAAWCCKGFGDCIVDTLGLVKDIICCPCTTCGKLCEECCKGPQNPGCCSDDAICCCCCSDCDCSGCDCDC